MNSEGLVALFGDRCTNIGGGDGGGGGGAGGGDDGDGADGGRQLTLIVVAELLLPLPHPHPLARKAILGKDLGYCWQNKCPNRD